MHGYVMGLSRGETQGGQGCPINPEIVLQLLVFSQFHILHGWRASASVFGYGFSHRLCGMLGI